MASIVQNIIGDNALQLGNEEFVRKMAWGNNWNYLRIGILFLVNGNTSIAGRVRLHMAVCSGDQYTFQSPACIGYTGIGFGVGGGLWTYSAPNYIMDTTGSTVTYGLKQVNGVLTSTSTNDSGFNYYARAVAAGAPYMLAVDIARPSTTSYSVKGYGVVVGKIGLNLRFYEFLRVMEDEGFTYGTTYLTAFTAVTMSGLPSVMDTLSIYWNKSVPTIEISALSVVRFF